MSVISAYKKYKKDAKGWGVPDFIDFRKRLWPLRKQYIKSKWSDDDMMYILELQNEGAGLALQNLFSSNKVVMELIGNEYKQSEPMSKNELISHIKALIKDCKRKKWKPEEFMAFIEYLDGNRTIEDNDPSQDKFKSMYQEAGEGYKRCVRELFAEGSEQ